MPNMVPTESAMIGVPRKRSKILIKLVHPAMEETELSAMSIIGTRIGASALKPLGSFPYSATSCS